MKKTLEDFYADNDVREGKDFQSIPPSYYHSLNEGLRAWCDLKTSMKQSLTLLLFNRWPRESIGFNFNYAGQTVSSILGFQRFFELLFKDILRRIDPFLAVKFLENEKQVVAYLNNSLSAEEVQSVEFSEAYKRFKEALRYAHDHPENEQYQLAKKFEFLKKDSCFGPLAKWRNRIMHNGKTIPNMLALDYLVTQEILPLVDQIFIADKDYIQGYRPTYLKTASGIDILSHILEIKFDFSEFYENPWPQNLIVGLLRIGHLKEILRSNYHFDHLILKNGSFEEPYYDDPLGRALRFSEAEKQNVNFHEIQQCPCCGIKTLVIYKKLTKDIFDNFKDKDYYFSKCTTCGYLMPENMGDPRHFGLSSDWLFHKESKEETKKVDS